MSYDPDDTICAIATASGGAARGMIRVSGREALSIVAPLFRTEGGSPIEWPASATALVGNVRISLANLAQLPALNLRAATDPCVETIVPCELFIWPNRRSYTREPVVELHTLGSTPLLEALLAAVCRAGARLAEPGEFTLRAFLAGRIDLTQVEAVLGVIDANRADQLDDALAQLAGGLAQPLHALRDDLLQLLAELEAGLDFVEEDIQFVSRLELLTRLDSACRVLAKVDHQMTSRQIAPETYQIALIGPPNSGKSSLFNALTKRFGVSSSENQSLATEALVSPERGTTRDYLTAALSLHGVRCELIDTAGIEASEIDRGESSYPRAQIGADIKIERTATALAAEHSRRATVRALCLDASCPAGDALKERSTAPFVPDCDVLVFTKADLLAKPIPSAKLKQTIPTVLTSSRTGEGIVELSKVLCAALASGETTRRGIAIASTANRCRESIRHAGAALASARDLAEHDRGAELIAAEIRASLDELGKVVGAIYTEDLLDRIFSTFCIGK